MFNVVNISRERSGRVSLGQAIRALRKKHGLTQQQLALAAGVSRTTVWQLESGRATLTVDNLLAIVSALSAEIRIEPRQQGYGDLDSLFGRSEASPFD